MKNTFDYTHMYLTGTNGGLVVINPIDILAVVEEDKGTLITLAHNGVSMDVWVKQTPGRIKQKVNNLAARQDKEHKAMEEEAAIKAKTSFFDKYPKTKAMFQAECAELGQKCDLKK